MHYDRSLEFISRATVIFMGFLKAKVYAKDLGKYSIENLSAGKPEAASMLTS